MGNLNFDASQVDPQQSFDPLPIGEYNALIEESEMKPTAAGTGHYLQMTFKVIDGEYAGRMFWERLNLMNPNQQTVEIAQKSLSALCHAIGVLNVQDSSQLHNKPVKVKLGINPAKGDYDASNKIKGYSAADGAIPVPAAAPRGAQDVPAQAAQAAHPADTGGPWNRAA